MLGQRDGLLGWATGRLIDHDTLAPGVIRRLLSSGPARRQAVFAFIAAELASERHDQIVGSDPDHAGAARRAEIIRDGSARDVLTEALGHEPPDGLRGTLERIGLSALREPRQYARLVEIFIDPKRQHHAEALRHVGAITSAMLHLLEVLPGSLVHANVLKRLDSISEARSFIEAVRFAKFANSRATDEAIQYALTRMGNQSGLDDVLARLIRRADRQLGTPIAADEEVRPLARVSEMIVAGRKFRNCLGTDPRIVGALLGRAAYAVFREQAVMEFIYLSTGTWMLMEVHGPRNAGVSSEIEEAAQAKCRSAAVAILPRARRRPGRFGRFSDHYEPCFLNAAV